MFSQHIPHYMDCFSAHSDDGYVLAFKGIMTAYVVFLSRSAIRRLGLSLTCCIELSLSSHLISVPIFDGHRLQSSHNMLPC
ncbi:hypothetical protein V6N13_090989 [Hibiscus sabdariffa]